MPLTLAHIPAIREALLKFKQALDATDSQEKLQANHPLYHNYLQHQHPVILQAEDALRQTLTPTNPSWEWSQPEDLQTDYLPRGLLKVLQLVWEAILRDKGLPPPFPRDQRNEWLDLIDEVLAEIGGRPGEPAACTPQTPVIPPSQGEGAEETQPTNTGKRNKQFLLARALCAWHKYNEGECEILKPISYKTLKTAGACVPSTVNRIIKKYFDSYEKYCDFYCNDEGRLSSKLKEMSDEYVDRRNRTNSAVLKNVYREGN